MESLLSQIKNCDHCRESLPFEPRPIVSGSNTSKIILVSQAPGKKAHDQNRAWDDASGKRLKKWLGVDDDCFYNPDNFAVLPMGFCYPGKGSSGDLPPQKECAPLWHHKVWATFENVKLTIVIGKYARDYYLKSQSKTNLTTNIMNYSDYLPDIFVLPHPSPVNRFWFSKNQWFEQKVIPSLQVLIAEILKDS